MGPSEDVDANQATIFEFLFITAIVVAALFFEPLNIMDITDEAGIDIHGEVHAMKEVAEHSASFPHLESEGGAIDILEEWSG
ncbi:MAG TPA: hypothetical protein VMW85_08325 [Methanomassiliicoccales archaeon]|nr:hypothetical protein [Methanomassiliicoccales archaeon]